MSNNYKTFKRGFNKVLPGNIVLWVLLVWFALAATVWEFRHPKANEFTVITNFKKVMLFQTEEEYQ